MILLEVFKMDVGFFTMPIHPIDKDYKKSLLEDRHAFLLADRLGFSEAYCGEHVTDAAENITSSALFIASIASCTKNIRLGTGTVNMPNSHPAAIAGQIAMLDHMLCLLYTSPSPRDGLLSRMPSSA